VTESFNQVLAAIEGKTLEQTTLRKKLECAKLVSTCPLLLQTCERLVGLLEGAENSNWNIVGLAWVILGFFKLLLASALAPIDPVQKKALKLKYTLEDVSLSHCSKRLGLILIFAAVRGGDFFVRQ